MGLRLVSRNLDLQYKSAFSEQIPDAYESLILDVMRGDRSLFIRSDELRAAWDIFTPVLHEIERQGLVPEPYPFGSNGPAAAGGMVMDAMDFITIATVQELERRAVELLVDHFTMTGIGKHAVMLTGGRTPLGVYRRIAAGPPVADDGLHVLISDERYVPPPSPENNYSHLTPMIRSLGIAESRVMRVVTEGLTLTESADCYHEQLRAYLDDRGRVTLGILGLGADGHLASLFTPQDIERGSGRCAIPVRRTSGPDRVSVTRDFLLHVDKIVFLVTGSDKRDIVDRLRNTPADVVAGQALAGMADVEVWFAAAD